MKIATWNVNSVRARLPRVLEWLEAAAPDVALLQELKTTAEAFPAEPIEDRGYNVAVHGQKTYNGVAILSRSPIEDVVRGLPGGEDDPQARYVEAFTAGVRVASIYLPNGNPAPGGKFDYKLDWMERLRERMRERLALEEAAVFGGDYNVAPEDDDVHDPEAWAGDALCRPESRNRLRRMIHLGLTDAFRAACREPGKYTFWDYQGGAWRKDSGVRIDHLLLSPLAADRLLDCGIDRDERGKEKASDHAPVWCTLS